MTVVDLHAELDGSPDAAPLVLLNSVGTSGAMWGAQVNALGEQYRLIRIDARGHGGSPVSPDDSVTIADLGTDVLAALDRLGVERAHLAGLSLGGMTAMWIGAHHPDRVRRLALLCTSAHPGNAESWLDRAAAVRRDGMGAVADMVVDRWITPDLKQRDPTLYTGLQDLLQTTDARSYAQCCELIGALDLRPDLPRITAPTLVIGGAEDPALPVDHQRVVANGIAGAHLEVVAPAAHLANIEQAGVVTQFLLRHFGAPASAETGFRTRREVAGDAHVDRTIASTTEFTASFQDFLTRYAWGDVWSRPGLSRRERSIATLAALVALGAENELGLHVRGALTNGLTQAEIAEVLQHTALYAGLPRSNRAFAIAQQILESERDE
jgi:3-oxoadipate enol-lactonase/4-carboxymuconolactone decarboxylase